MPRQALAFRLLADWYRKQDGGDLEDLVRRQRALNLAAPNC